MGSLVDFVDSKNSVHSVKRNTFMPLHALRGENAEVYHGGHEEVAIRLIAHRVTEGTEGEAQRGYDCWLLVTELNRMDKILQD